MVKAGRWLRNLLGGRKDNATKDKSTEPKKPAKDRRRWSFGRSKPRNSEETTENVSHSRRDGGEREEEQTKHAMAVAAATAAAAEAAVAAAQAAEAVVRLTSNGRSLFTGGVSREEWAAVRIQTAFRGYLARRALRALKGLVKLQALVRGHIVRKQAAITLRCMQALVRVQARVRARRVRMSDEGQAVQRQLFQRRQQDSRPRRSMDRWNGSSGTGQEMEARGGSKNGVKRERGTANGFSEQPRRTASKQTSSNNGNHSMVIDCEPDKAHWGWTWLDRWMAARPWESPFFDELMNGTEAGDRGLEEAQAKIVEMDTGRPRPRAAGGTAAKRRNGSMSEAASVEPSLASTPSALQQPAASPFARPFFGPTSPGGRLSIPSPADSDGEAAATVHAADAEFALARRPADDQESVVSTAQSSPRMCAYSGKRCSAFGTPRAAVDHQFPDNFSEDFGGFPNYMATTQSSKAKVRSQSAPKQRPDPAEKGGAFGPPAAAGPKKRLSLHEGGRSAASAAVRMQRSSSQVRSVAKGFVAGPIRLDRSSLSLRDSDTSSVNGDFRRAFK